MEILVQALVTVLVEVLVMIMVIVKVMVPIPVPVLVIVNISVVVVLWANRVTIMVPMQVPSVMCSQELKEKNFV